MKVDAQALFAELAVAKGAGNVHDVQQITAQIVESYLPLVHAVARGLRVHLELDDRVQEGCLALYAAITAYKPERGPFGAYARVWIRGQILKAARATPLMDSLDDQDDGTSLHEQIGADTDDVLPMESRVDFSRAVTELEHAEQLEMLRGLATGTPVHPSLTRRLRRRINGD